ncbi:tail fiber domain-containing protein [Patescibacteria group bacterium]|nr:tail fiber domain-containing protein [Patescibacteria group bacterium]
MSGDIVTDVTYIVSDRNKKTEIVELTNTLLNLLNISGYTFTWIASQRDDI